MSKRRRSRKKETLTGPRFQFARSLAAEHAEEFMAGRGGCALCERRRAAVLYQKILSADQVRRLGTSHREATVVNLGVCATCLRLPDAEARLDARLERDVGSPGSVIVHDLGDLPLPDCLV